jgi:hypothetical protein
MTAAAQPVILNPREKTSGLEKIIESTKVVWPGARLSVATDQYATSAARGHVQPFARAKGQLDLGYANPQGFFPTFAADGTTPLSRTGNAGGTIKTATIIDADQLPDQSVTGVSAITDVGQWVWMTDDKDYSLTAPTDTTGFPGVPDGFVLDWLTSTRATIYRFGMSEKVLIHMMGGIHRELYLGKFNWVNLATGAGIVVISNGHLAPFHAKVLKLYAITDTTFTGSSGSADINVEIADAVVSTVGLTLSTAATSVKGTRTDATILSTARMHEGDEIEVTADDVTDTRTTGDFHLWMRVRMMLGL